VPFKKLSHLIDWNISSSGISIRVNEDTNPISHLNFKMKSSNAGECNFKILSLGSVHKIRTLLGGGGVSDPRRKSTRISTLKNFPFKLPLPILKDFQKKK
jgi:hypothetical protein